MDEAKDPYTLLGPMVSYHLNREANHNERHPAIGLLTPGGWSGGVYKNSYGKTSVFGGKEFKTQLMPGLSAGLQAGLVTGYPAAPVLPALLPQLIADLPADQQLALLLMPPAGKFGQGGVALQYRKRLK